MKSQILSEVVSAFSELVTDEFCSVLSASSSSTAISQPVSSKSTVRQKHLCLSGLVGPEIMKNCTVGHYLEWINYRQLSDRKPSALF
jgi:hypothetical protein